MTTLALSKCNKIHKNYNFSYITYGSYASESISQKVNLFFSFFLLPYKLQLFLAGSKALFASLPLASRHLGYVM